MTMIYALRSLCSVQRCYIQFKITHQYLPCRSFKSFVKGTLQPVKSLQKYDQCIKQSQLKFHTTRRLDVPPLLALIVRPLVNIAAFLFGRYFKKWWAQQTPAQKEMYKKWLISKRGVFLGIFGAFLSGLGIYYIQHLETDPLTNRKRLILLNKEQQTTLAKLTYEVHLVEHQNNLVPKDHPTYKKIAAVTNKLLTANKELPFVKDHTWTLNVINSDTKNAYVLPGGHIFVFLGTLNMVDNEDQLAIILSHEMAHVLLQHPIEQISYGVILDLLIAVPLAVLWAMFPDLVAFLLQSLAKSILAIFIKLPYSRGLEKEADEVGLQLAAKACVDVREAVVFWATMKALVDLNIQPAEIPWLSTHPDNEEREKFLDARIPDALELRLKSGCMGVHRIDPRQQFKARSVKDREAAFKERGFVWDVYP